MRNFLIATCLIVGISACNTQNAITENNSGPDKPAFTMADVKPVLFPKSKEQKVNQQKFLKDNTQLFKSKELASKYYVLQAHRNFNDNKIDSASIYFGRAWLMDSTNNDILWGYGKIYGQKKEYDKALFLFYRAMEKDKGNADLMTDVATSHLQRFYETSNPEDLLQSKKLLESAISLSKDQADAYYKLSITSYYLSDYENAWGYLHKSLSQHKEIADKNYITALLTKQKDPKGVYIVGSQY